MTVWQKGVITLIKSALKGEKYPIPVGLDLEKTIQLAQIHQIPVLLYYGAAINGFDKNSLEMKKLFNLVCAHLQASEQQLYEVNRVSEAFEAEDIDFLPLKGMVLKSMYEKPEMRAMGDCDILIKIEQYERIKIVLEKLGYGFCYESDHELVWSIDGLCLELHKSIVPTYDEDFYSFFGDGWDVAIKEQNSSKHHMSDEDFYIYMFVHFAKHFRNTGIGIKHLVDFWVFAKEVPTIDWEYIEQQLEKFGLAEFFENVKRTVSVWFDGAEANSKTDIITETIFSGGAFGDFETGKVSRVLCDVERGSSLLGTKARTFLKLVFLPYKHMCEKYAILKKIPILLPFTWVIRIFSVIVFKRKKVVSYKKKQSNITSGTLKKRKEQLLSIGLDPQRRRDL